MKKLNKKGFTIVELVIVIAVIAILAGVLIPTFSGVINKANESADLQTAKNAHTIVLAADRDADLGATVYVKLSDTKWYKVTGGELTKEASAPDVTGMHAIKKTVVGGESNATALADLPDNVTVYVGTGKFAA